MARFTQWCALALVGFDNDGGFPAGQVSRHG